MDPNNKEQMSLLEARPLLSRLARLAGVLPTAQQPQLGALHVL